MTNNNLMLTLAHVLRHFDLTVEDLAQVADIAPEVLQAAMEGHRDLSAAARERIASVLQLGDDRLQAAPFVCAACGQQADGCTCRIVPFAARKREQATAIDSQPITPPSAVPIDSPEDEIYRDGLMTVDEAATYLALSKSMIYQMMDSGRLRYAKFGRARRIPRRAVLDLLKSNMCGGWQLPNQAAGNH